MVGPSDRGACPKHEEIALAVNTLELKVENMERELVAQKAVNDRILASLDDVKARITQFGIYLSVFGSVGGIIVANWDKIAKLL